MCARRPRVVSLSLALSVALLSGALLPSGCRSVREAPSLHPFERNAALFEERPDLEEDEELLGALDRVLAALFGFQEEPRYHSLEEWEADGFDPNRWPETILGLGPEERPSLAESAALFRARCSRCHGLAGGGDGPMAPRLRTPPRDYRAGTFKKTPLERGERPRGDDLARILREGVPGTGMPAWEARLSPREIAGLVDYVRFLAIRGETERLAFLELEPGEPLDEGLVRDAYRFALSRWRVEHHPIDPGPPPQPTPERIARGEWLFRAEQGAGCVRCHGPEGHGNGPAALVPDPESGELVPFRDEWGNPIRPRDLVCASIRFGEAPEDLYRRIHAGIAGTPMPAHAGALVTERDGTRHPLGPDDVWDLVLFVETLRERGAAADQTGARPSR